MMLKSNGLKTCAMVVATSVLGMSSCKVDEPSRLSLQDTADLTEEALTDAYFQDTDDMAGVAIDAPTDAEYSSGRTSGAVTVADHRFCEGITVTVASDEMSTADVPKGVLTIDFGTTGCTDEKASIRKGKRIFTYSCRRFQPGSTVITTTENYFINGVKLEGTRTLTNKSNSTEDVPRFGVVLANGKATFPNEQVATRESNITWQLNRAESKRVIETTSTASGTTRGGRAYDIMLLEPLVYQRHCGIAVSGIKKYTINGEKEVTIDYGDGTCDRAFTVTVNGVTHQVGM
jgi:hypothetical protein